VENLEDLPRELATFLAGEQDPGAFRHADHVRVAFEVLKRHSFLSAAEIYSQKIKAMTQRIGKPTAYNETITVAFLSAIAEQMAKRPYESFEEFAAENPDLLDKNILTRWYTKERLSSAVARETFVLPEPSGLGAREVERQAPEPLLR
jgi:hypothetical protein